MRGRSRLGVLSYRHPAHEGCKSGQGPWGEKAVEGLALSRKGSVSLSNPMACVSNSQIILYDMDPDLDHRI